MRRLVLPFVVLACTLAACTPEKRDGRGGADPAKLHALHRGELAAVASYDDAIHRFPSLTAVDLAKIRADHMDAADRLKGRLVALGVTPDASAGVWGDWSEGLTKAAGVFGEDAALRTLQMGEKHGQGEYQEALNRDSVDADSKRLIRDVLLPRQQQHLDALDHGVKTN